MIFCLLMFFKLTAAGIPNERQEISGSPRAAIETRIEEVPFIVSIQAKVTATDCPGSVNTCEAWQHICTGIIVSEHHVITGAPCFFKTSKDGVKKERDPHNILVMAGSDRRDSGRRMAVSHFCYHKNYGTNSSSDSYGLIFLHDNFKFGTKVKVAKTPKGRFKDSSKELSGMIHEHRLGFVYGWDMKKGSDNKQLLMIQIRLGAITICDTSEIHGINASQHFCGRATVPDNLADIGSPFVIDKVVWGYFVTSGDGVQPSTLFSRMDATLGWKAIVLASSQPSIMCHSFVFLRYNIILFFFLQVIHRIYNM
ncbi:uncharacterized protein [Halyomorpha halys]|uniref:uncharacterized protein n=1 Tax=Halyomorpha halys TaxID=286706 RepID=UPI0034D1D542